MMSAKLLKHTPKDKQTWFYRKSEKVFEDTIASYGRTLEWILDHEWETLMVAIGTLVLTIVLYIVVPKGFFPVQDTGVIQGVSEAPQNVSFAAMARGQQDLARIILQDPAVESLSSFVGIDGTNTTVNSGRILINLKPLEVRKVDITTVINRLQPKLEAANGLTLYLQPVQDLTVEDRVSRTQYQYSLEDPSADELNLWTKKLVDKLKTIPALRNVATDQQNDGWEEHIVIDRLTASRLGITPNLIDQTLYDAFGQRQVSTMFTQLNQYHVVLEVAPQFQRNPHALDDIYIRSNTGGEVPLSAFTKFVPGAAPLAVNHEGQFPAVTISFNLAPGYSLGDAVSAIDQAREQIGMPASIEASFQGTAAAFRASLTNEPLLILAALVTVYIVLGVLYESYIHPMTILSTLPSAGVGAILALMICGQDLNVIALIGIILLIGIVKKNAIMMIDFALEAERKEGKPPARGDLPGLPAALPSDHDDHDGGVARRRAAGAGQRESARSCAARSASHRRRPAGQPGADAFHDAGYFSDLRPHGDASCQVADRGCSSGDGSSSSVMISEVFIRKPVATTLLTIALALAGAIAFRLLPVAPLPQVEFPTIQVQAALPGASPETMASSVATPLERQFGRIAGLTELTSTSYLGATSIVLQFDLTRNIDAAARDDAGRHQCRGRATADDSAEQADLSEGQSRRCADHDSRPDLGRRAPGIDVRRG